MMFTRLQKKLMGASLLVFLGFALGLASQSSLLRPGTGTAAQETAAARQTENLPDRSELLAALERRRAFDRHLAALRQRASRHQPKGAPAPALEPAKEAEEASGDIVFWTPGKRRAVKLPPDGASTRVMRVIGNRVVADYRIARN